jgi:hypothetical protein
VVREVGAAPAVQIVLDAADGEVAVHGPLRDEIGSLIGAEIRAEGMLTANRPPPPVQAIAATDYEIVSINGRRPVVGILREQGGEYRVGEGEAAVPLTVVPDALKRRLGAKVWVVGSQAAAGLAVQSFGVIRDPE